MVIRLMVILYSFFLIKGHQSKVVKTNKNSDKEKKRGRKKEGRKKRGKINNSLH